MNSGHMSFKLNCETNGLSVFFRSDRGGAEKRFFVRQRLLWLCFLGRVIGLCLVFVFLSNVSWAETDAARAVPDGALLSTAYSGGETFTYSITWLGIKAGELTMVVEAVDGQEETFRIIVTAKSAGLLALFYPVEDRFETIVQGAGRLPTLYTIDQQEGKRRNRKSMTYDQAGRQITYRKNEENPVTYTVNGPVHNEFSSFMIMRAMPFASGRSVVIPTFADKKRHEVEVLVREKKDLSTILGTVNTLAVQPRLNFKGLYEKVGDPLIWLTDDARRVPVRIKAQIVIGSLTATLVGYEKAGQGVAD